MKKEICVGVVGSGVISEIYLQNMTTRFRNLRVKAVASRHAEHARKRAEQFGIACCSVEELLADPEIELIVNLTPLASHYGIVKAALEAGKHAYTEKPLADTLERAAELAALAKEKHLVLGSAPDTFLGAGIQTAKAALQKEMIGEVTGFDINANRDWCTLMNMLPFLREKGPGMCYDFAVYHLTALVSLLGPVATVAAITKLPKPYKHTFPTDPDFGKEMRCPNETRVSTVLELESGVTGTLMLDGDSIMDERPFIRLYGTKGMLEIGDPNYFGSPTRVLVQEDPAVHGEFETLDFVNEFSDNSRGLGVSVLADAILHGKPALLDIDLAYHVVEVLTRILESSESRRFLAVESTCAIPDLLKEKLT